MKKNLSLKKKFSIQNFKSIFLIISLLIIVLGCKQKEISQGAGEQEVTKDSQEPKVPAENEADNPVQKETIRIDNIDDCQNIDDENLREDCKNRLITIKAVQTKDSSICNQILGSYKENCIKAVGVALENK